MTNLPEHDKREQAHGLHPDVDAAYDYVISVRHTADAGAGAWHGWALREAFLAGISYAKARELVRLALAE